MSGKGDKRRPQYIYQTQRTRSLGSYLLHHHKISLQYSNKLKRLESQFQIEAIRKPIPNEKDKMQ